MDGDQLKRLAETLADIRIRYDDAREIVRGMRAHEAPDTEAAYWIGVAQSFSKQAADDLMALSDAVNRLQFLARQPPEAR